MKVTPTDLPGVWIVEPRVFPDDRGHFFESWQDLRYGGAVTPLPFVQDSVSVSRRGVVRGLHLQHPSEQGKLVSVPHGAVFDVAVDARRGSPTFGKWTGVELSGGAPRQLWIPPGFLHGFQALEDGSVLYYKCTGRYDPAAELTVIFDDPDLAIAWPLPQPIVSAKDRQATTLARVRADRLPPFP